MDTDDGNGWAFNLTQLSIKETLARAHTRTHTRTGATVCADERLVIYSRSRSSIARRTLRCSRMFSRTHLNFMHSARSVCVGQCVCLCLPHAHWPQCTHTHTRYDITIYCKCLWQTNIHTRSHKTESSFDCAAMR